MLWFVVVQSLPAWIDRQAGRQFQLATTVIQIPPTYGSTTNA
jgi:hypothetical protein